MSQLPPCGRQETEAWEGLAGWGPQVALLLMGDAPEPQRAACLWAVFSLLPLRPAELRSERHSSVPLMSLSPLHKAHGPANLASPNVAQWPPMADVAQQSQASAPFRAARAGANDLLGL